MKRRVIMWGVIALLMMVTLTAHAQLDTFGNLRLGNQYVEIVVNGNQDEMGRFAIDITGGNPITLSDDGEPLIYGRPRPWTSFTTVQIDGVNYVFGGKTEQRSGKNGQYGIVTVPPTIVTEAGESYISTITQFNQIEVEQVLSFSKSSTTGLYDTVMIKYRVTNHDEKEHKVGVRVMIDTMLGSNDGAPFRVGDQAITTDTYFLKSDLPGFWQAFDALSDTKVTAQGTLKGPDVATPDKIYYADWGSMADGLWNFSFEAGQEFWREGEFELDSAIALFWDPTMLNAGESRSYSTKYGLGGITVVPGILSLGVTSPAEVTFDTQINSFPVVAYIENTSEIMAKDVVAQIHLPAGFVVVGNANQKPLGNLEPGKTGQIAWEVMPQKGSKVPDKITYKVKADASNTDSNEVDRLVTFTPPPKLNVWLSHPDKLTIQNERLNPNPFELTLHMRNTGGSPAYEVLAQAILPPGLEFAEKEQMSKSIGLLNPGEEYVFPWMIRVSNMVTGNVLFGVDVRSNNAGKSSLTGKLVVPELSSKAYMVLLREQVKVGDYFGVQIRAANIKDMESAIFNMVYSAKDLQALYVSRGTLFVHDGLPLPWSEPLIDRENGFISGIQGIMAGSTDENGVLAEVYFKAVKSGKFTLNLSDVIIQNSKDERIPLKIENLTITIVE